MTVVHDYMCLVNLGKVPDSVNIIGRTPEGPQEALS